MRATELFPPDLRADICAKARENHARQGRGVLFVKPMPDGSGQLDSEYFQSCQLSTLDELKAMADFDLVAFAFDQSAVYDPARQCVLLWLGEDERIHCETIDDPHADSSSDLPNT